MERYQKFGVLFQFGYITFIVSLMMSFAIQGGASGLSHAPNANKIFEIMLFLSIFSLSMIAALILSTINLESAQEEGYLRQGNFIALLSGTLAGVEILNDFVTLPSVFYFYSQMFLNIFLTYLVISVGVNLVRIRGRLPFALGIIPCVAIVTILVLKGLYRNFLSQDETLLFAAYIRLFSMLLLPFVLIGLTYKVRSLRLDNRLWSAIRHRFFCFSTNGIGLGIFYSLVFIESILAFFSLYSMMSVKTTGVFVERSYFPIYSLSLAWLPFMVVSLIKYYQLKQIIVNYRIVSSLASEQAQRFVYRSKRIMEQPWATVIGVRTANFLIDHDPKNCSSTRITTTLSQIRKDEILQNVIKGVAPKLLHVRILGNQIYGAIDPEKSIRSCVDVLSLFTCIYIDAIPLVERRLVTLASLFPIVDPDLASFMNPKIIEASMARLEWVFHLDFDWIDEQAVERNLKTAYQVDMGNLDELVKKDILNNLQEKNRLGNVIWVTQRARERLLMEAPYLSSVIETWPVKLQNHQGEGETIYTLFSIKFEDLIPRMQKYFALEELRRNFQDYKESPETRHFVNMLDIQVTSAETPEAIITSLRSMSNFVFHGFREKDSALKLILKGYNKCIERGQEDNVWREDLRLAFLEIVNEVGYPSQIVHMAHSRKRALREVEHIKTICLDPDNSRFEEGWIFLASLNTALYKKEELLDLIATAFSAMANKLIWNRRVVRMKLVEVCYNLLGTLKDCDYKDTVENHINVLGLHLIKIACDADLFCFFLDAKIYLEEKHQRSYFFTNEIFNALDQYSTKLLEDLKSNSASASFVSSRWKIALEANNKEQKKEAS